MRRPAKADLDHRTTKPRHSWTDGQVERMNRTIKDRCCQTLLLRKPRSVEKHLNDFNGASRAMKCFMERLIFPWLPYEADRSTLFSRKMPVGALYTMNVPEQVMKERDYHGHIANFLKRVFGSCETLWRFNTYQFDYSKMAANRFDVEEKMAQRRDVFPSDCQKASDMSARFATVNWKTLILLDADLRGDALNGCDHPR